LKKEITLSVNYGRNKQIDFDVYIVPNRFNVDYYEYIKRLKSVQELSVKLAEAESIEQVQEIEETAQTMDLESILKDKYNLVKTILIANEYEFDAEFWDKKVSPDDVDNFISNCAIKDKPEQVKKKLLAISANSIMSV